MDLTQTGRFNEHTSGSNPKITVLICALNEAENLPYVLPKIPSSVDEVLLVDGHSTDATIQISKQLCPKIRVVHQPGRGKGDALKFGVQQAVGDIIVTLDADGQNDPNEIANFVRPLLDGYEFAKGSRLVNGRPSNMMRRRYVGNKILATASNMLHGTKYTDICSGYNAFRKDAFSRVELSQDGFEMEQQMNVRIKKAGLRVVEVPCTDHGRHSGSSKTQDVKQGLKDLLIIARERFRR